MDYEAVAQSVRHLRSFGFPLIPISADKTPLVMWKQYQNTRPTDEEFEAWIRTEPPPPAWAIVTGSLSRVVVLDFDGETGNATMARLGLAPHLRTGSGGHHVWFEHPGWRIPTVSGKAKKALGEAYPGLDIRGDQGIAAVVGRNQSGEYQWLRAFDMYKLEILPEDLRELIGVAAPPPDSPAQEASQGFIHTPASDERIEELLRRALEMATSGGRNNAGFWLACQLRDAGLMESEAWQFLKRFIDEVPSANSKGQEEPYTTDEALSSIRQAFNRPPREPWGRSSQADEGGFPTIIVGNRDLRDLSSDSLAALQAANAPETLFTRSGQMVQVVTDEKRRHFIAEMTEPGLLGRLARCANFRRWATDRNGNRIHIAVNPPSYVVRDLLSLAPLQWRFPPIDGVVEVPTMRSDGTIVATPGYDVATQVVYAPPYDFQLPAISSNPTAEELASKKTFIREMLGGFPFVDQASYANMLATFFTALLRRAITGCVPLPLIDAPSAGTGKTLLAELVAIIATGSEGTLQPAPGDEEEWRKSLTSVLASGRPLVIFDNVSTRLLSPSLALAVTASVWADRILGENRIATLPQKCTWIITGNNITLGADIPRRSYWIRLDARSPRPWQGREFKIKDLRKWTMENRGEIIAAFLTLAKAWYAAGRPPGNHYRLGSFESWCEVIGGILGHAGVVGFLGNIEDMYAQSDPGEEQWEVFLTDIFQRFDGGAFSVNELVRDLRKCPEFHALLPDDLYDDDTKGNVLQRKVGIAFRQRAERRYGPSGVHLARAGMDKSAKVARWRVDFQTKPAKLPPKATPPGTWPQGPGPSVPPPPPPGWTGPNPKPNS